MDKQIQQCAGSDTLASTVAALIAERDAARVEVAQLREALNEMHVNTENRQDEPFIAYIRRTCAAALSGGGK